MIPPTDPQLLQMLLLQDRANTVMGGAGWLTAGHSYARAVRVECAELTDHLGWKWWKKQSPDWPQAKLEMVDIWHFIMSQVLVASHGKLADATHTIRADIGSIAPLQVIEMFGRTFTLHGLTLHERIDVLSSLAGMGFVSPSIFHMIMDSMAMTWDELYKIYVAKNVLNMFRQRHGDKEGKYIKVWAGREDNVVLDELMTADPGITAHDLDQKLEYIYSGVANGPEDR